MGGLQLLSLVASLGCFICGIIVLIKLFQEEGALKGILGLICGLYTLIWGWMNSERLGIKNIMLIWTLLLIVTIILTVMGGGFSYRVGAPMTP
jgi:hypothetical protein